MRCTRIPRRGIMALAIVAGACRSPAADAAVAEQLSQMTNEIIGLRDQMAMLSTTVDSLVIVAARQDTLIKRMAAMNGAPTP